MRDQKIVGTRSLGDIGGMLWTRGAVESLIAGFNAGRFSVGGQHVMRATIANETDERVDMLFHLADASLAQGYVRLVTLGDAVTITDIS